MKKKLLMLFSALAVVLEILPWGAVLVFAGGGDAPVRHHYSYFDITPYGYANFAPFLCAIATVILLVTSVVYWYKDKGLKFLQVIAGAAALLSLAPVLSGWSYVSIQGTCIALVLLAATVLSFWQEKKPSKKGKKKK